MSAITNYSSLIQNIKDISEDDSTEFSNYIPTAIDLAEKRIIKELDLVYSQEESTVINQGDYLIDKPDGYLFNFDFYIKNSEDLIIPLIRVTDNFLRDYWPDSSEEGIPKYYADLNQTSFIIAPSSNDVYTVYIDYYKRPDSLSVTTPTNILMDKFSDSLFFATMVEMCIFMRSYEQMGIWEQKYQSSILGANNQGRRERRDDERTPANPSGGLNTLQQGQV